MGKEVPAQLVWQDSVIEAIRLADLRYLELTALAISVLLSVKNKNWSKWSDFCQDTLATAKKLEYLGRFHEVDPTKVCELIEAGTKIIVDSKGAGLLIDNLLKTKLDTDLLAASALLVTIYTLSGSNWKKTVQTLAKVSSEGWGDKLYKSGVTPDLKTTEDLKYLFTTLARYAK